MPPQLGYVIPEKFIANNEFTRKSRKKKRQKLTRFHQYSRHVFFSTADLYNSNNISDI